MLTAQSNGHFSEKVVVLILLRANKGFMHRIMADFISIVMLSKEG